ncbi:5'-nucleotidase SurE [Oxobacter pfennigii]|uniref:5'-nucleotidase SurE n=1 Tax=Oxobacter pfennigii TaxID=36849 RepID=A0A0P8WQP4_9CLOT|nr:5'/3'-nucleotidase SurE [Oxobacter pfennigii]KPU44862.1 5'-nucleotidase SurE [Oxobacter pfennigii]
MNILITNDDGIDSPGIYALTKQFIHEGNVVISAPDRQRSACSHSITMHGPITVLQYSFYNLNCKAYAVSGTPVDCVKLAYEKFAEEKFDVVLSGINDGGNLGSDVLYSGTVSAAIEGALLGIPSIAISLSQGNGSRDYDAAAHYAYEIYRKYLSEKFLPGTVLNVNVPPVKKDEIKGIIATSLGDRKYNNNYEERLDPQGNIHYWLTGDIVKTENNNATDIYAVENNYVSVTPMHFELTKYEYINKISKWFMKE